MESDNLQHLWQSQELPPQRKKIDKAYLADAALKIKDSHKRLLRKLFLEIFMGLLIYIGAGLLLFFLQAEKREILFALKLILLTALYAIPSTLLLYQSIAKLKADDYTIPLNEHLKNSVTSLKKSVRIYWLTGLLACLFIIIALFTDKFYLSQSTWLQIGGLLYVLLFAILLSPVLRHQYGREIKILEKQIQELEKS